MSQIVTSVKLTVLPTNPSIYPLSSSVSRALTISELLRTIFLFCVAEDGEEPKYTDLHPWSLNLYKRSRRRYPLMSGKEAPLLLAHICRSWRRTALDTPQLWACLHLHIPEHIYREPWLSSTVGFRPLIERRLSALKFWLKTSRDCPISVYFTVGWRVEYGSRAWYSREDDSRILSKYPVAARFSQELLKHAHRWENVFLCLPKADLLPFYDNFQQKLPLLKHFEIDKPHTKIALETAPSRDLSIYSTPKLKGLALSGTTSDYVLVPDGLPHTLRAVQLTYVALRFTQNENGHRLRELVLFHIPINETDFARFPSVFPLLEQLTLMNCLCRRAEQGEVIDAVVLDKLCSLRLRSPYIFNCFPLPWMVAPTLRHLDLTIEGRGGVIQGADVRILNRNHEIVRFLRRSRAPIKSFCYRSTQKSDVIEEMLIAMPGLVKLRCEGFLLPLATLKALSHSVCPCLKSIYNECPLPACDRLISRYRPNAEDFAELIGARCRSRRDIELGRIGKIGGSSFISELAFPVHEAHEILLRASREFKEAEVRWTNTHICGDTCPDFD